MAVTVCAENYEQDKPHNSIRFVAITTCLFVCLLLGIHKKTQQKQTALHPLHYSPCISRWPQKNRRIIVLS